MKYRANGMTLIEILITMTLFVIMMLGISGVFFWGTKGTIQNKNAAIASSLVQNRMERLKNSSYAHVSSYVNNSEVATVTVGTDYKAELKVEAEFIDDPQDRQGIDDNDGNPNDYLKVTITINWTEGMLSRKRGFSSYIIP